MRVERPESAPPEAVSREIDATDWNLLAATRRTLLDAGPIKKALHDARRPP